eukprot:gene330-1127_t
MSHFNASAADRRSSAPAGSNLKSGLGYIMQLQNLKRAHEGGDGENPKKLGRMGSNEHVRGGMGQRKQRRHQKKLLEENSAKWLAWNVALRPTALPNVHRTTTGPVATTKQMSSGGAVAAKAKPPSGDELGDLFGF